jgi:hypothetical protein
MTTTLLSILAGPTHARLALAHSPAGALDARSLQPSRVVPITELAGAARAALAGLGAGAPLDGRVLLACDDPTEASRLDSAVRDATGWPVIRLVAPGAHEPSGAARVPLATDLTPPIDATFERLLAALGAHRRSRQACLVVDCGAQVSVDFVDAYGVLRGGVLAPGLGAMLGATDARTRVAPPTAKGAMPAGPIGMNTADAMLLGAAGAVRGLVRYQAERVAELAGSYPRVIATGADAALLLEEDDLVEHIVPDLAMVGMLEAWQTIDGAEADGDERAK